MEKTSWAHPPYHPLSVFRYIHRHFLLLAVSDMVLGMAIGGIWHQELIGATVGGVFSIFNSIYLGRTIFRFLIE